MHPIAPEDFSAVTIELLAAPPTLATTSEQMSMTSQIKIEIKGELMEEEKDVSISSSYHLCIILFPRML